LRRRQIHRAQRVQRQGDTAHGAGEGDARCQPHGLAFELVNVRRGWFDGGADDVRLPGLIFERQRHPLRLMLATRQVGGQAFTQPCHTCDQGAGIAQRWFAQVAAFQHQGRSIGVDAARIAPSGQVVEQPGVRAELPHDSSARQGCQCAQRGDP